MMKIMAGNNPKTQKGRNFENFVLIDINLF